MTTPGIILLEGPDCSGKTTLAKKLCDYWKAQYFHSSYIKGLDVMHYHRLVINQALYYAQNGPVVIDRLYPSEMIYGLQVRNNIYNSSVKADDQPWLTIDYLEHHNRLEAVNAIHIYCIPGSITNALKRYTNNIDEDHPYDLNQWEKIYMLYNEWYLHMEQYHPKTKLFHYDIDSDGQDINKFISSLTY